MHAAAAWQPEEFVVELKVHFFGTPGRDFNGEGGAGFREPDVRCAIETDGGLLDRVPHVFGHPGSFASGAAGVFRRLTRRHFAGCSRGRQGGNVVTTESNKVEMDGSQKARL